MERAKIKSFAKDKLKGKMWEILGACIIVTLISGAFSGTTVKWDGARITYSTNILSIIGEMLVFILEIGLTTFMVNFVTNKEYNFEQIFSKFKNWKNILIVYWHQTVMIFLFTLLLIVPGIIKALGYSLVPYILMDDPDMTSTEILKLSEEMMNGHKMELFMLGLSFIGWHILAIFTLGILELWIIPYQQTTVTKFLNDIKENYNKTIGTTEKAA